MNEQLKYLLPDNLLDALTNGTNRAKAQTQFLFDLCDGDLVKLFELEERIKNLHLSYCPGDKESVENVMQMPFDRTKQWFFLSFTAVYKLEVLVKS